MGTHGCIRVSGEGHRKGILLHTTNTGMDIPDCIKEAPNIILKQRFYIRSESSLRSAIRSDGTLWEWLFYPQCVCSMLIAARPMMLCHVPPSNIKHLAKWSGADNPWILKIRNDLWYLTDPKTKETEEIDPIDLIIKKIDEIKAKSTLFCLPYEELSEAVKAENRNQLLLSGYVDYDFSRIVLLTGDHKIVSLPFDAFYRSGDDTTPDFNKISLSDYGHTLCLGPYEASARYVLEYKES